MVYFTHKVHYIVNGSTVILCDLIMSGTVLLIANIIHCTYCIYVHVHVHVHVEILNTNREDLVISKL